MFVIIKLDDFINFPKPEYDDNGILTKDVDYKGFVVAQKYEDVLCYIDGDLDLFKSKFQYTLYTEYPEFYSFREPSKGEVIDKAFVKNWFIQYKIKQGCITSISDSDGKNIIMQCGERDVLLLSNSPIKTFVRDINNVTHSVTETEFDKIFEEVKIQGLTILQESWQL